MDKDVLKAALQQEHALDRSMSNSNTVITVRVLSVNQFARCSKEGKMTSSSK